MINFNIHFSSKLEASQALLQLSQSKDEVEDVQDFSSLPAGKKIFIFIKIIFCKYSLVSCINPIRVKKTDLVILPGRVSILATDFILGLDNLLFVMMVTCLNESVDKSFIIHFCVKTLLKYLTLT